MPVPAPIRDAGKVARDGRAPARVLPLARGVWLLLLVAVSLPRVASAQPRETREQVNAWLSLYTEVQVANRWFADADLSIRRSGPLDEMAQLLPRVSVRYQPASAIRFNWGYAFSETWPYGKLPVAFRAPEHRMWEQVQLSQSLGRVALTHRYRLEQRWLGRVAEEDGEARVQNWVRTNRVRYRVLSTVPLQGSKLDDGEYYASAGDEVFINWGANIQRNVLDQNRITASLGRRFSKSLRMELGYLEQLSQKSDGRHLERNHTIVLSIFSVFSAMGAPAAGTRPASSRAASAGAELQ
ncbi:MAG: DUF2490 domain-containing protein [Gemmatimonadota bacterium]